MREDRLPELPTRADADGAATGREVSETQTLTETSGCGRGRGHTEELGSTRDCPRVLVAEMVITELL